MIPFKGKRKTSLKLKISNLKKPKNNFVRILETKLQEKFDKIHKRFVGGVVFCNFGSHMIPC